jgi:signal transduction histidine kinase
VFSDVATSVGKAVMPILVSAYGGDPARLIAALGALTQWVANGCRIFAEEYVAVSTQSLRALAARIEDTREDERKTLAREIHDALGQQLTGLKLDVRWLMRRLPDGDRSAALGKLHSMSATIDATISSMRQLGTDLRPRVLDDLGVGDALAWHARWFEKRFGLRVLLDVPDEDLALDVARSTTLFRCFQELLSNVARHAEAKDVSARLARESGCIVLEVHDDGRGIAITDVTSPHTLGLLGIRERVAALHGTFSIGAAPGGGTTAIIRLPESS